MSLATTSGLSLIEESGIDEEMLVASAVTPELDQSSGDLYKWLIALVSIISVAILLFLSREKMSNGV